MMVLKRLISRWTYLFLNESLLFFKSLEKIKYQNILEHLLKINFRLLNERDYKMGDKGKKDREKSRKQKSKKKNDKANKAKKKQEKNPKDTLGG